jgi:hypothetical protein
MPSRSRALIVVAALAIAPTACSSPDRENDPTPAVTGLTLSDRGPTSLPDHGGMPLTVEGDVIEVVDHDALLLGGEETDEVLVVVPRAVDVDPGARVEVTGVAQVLDIEELERELARTFDDRLRSFEGDRVIVAEAVNLRTSEAADNGNDDEG